jgi:hypothetical protein
LAFTLYGNRLNLNFYGFGEILVTDQVLRDPGAWYHIVLAFDSTQSTAVDRAKVYVNGSRVTAFSTSPSITQNADYPVNGAVLHEIGRFSSGEGYYFDGYLANIHFIDGQALDPSSFTETDATTGQLIPKTYTGSYGTNGFNLLFADNSSNTASTLGKDYSGLGNNWTPNNFSTSTGGPTSVAAATGALPVFNTTDTYGTVKGTGTRTDTNSASIVLALPMDGTNGGTSFGDQSAVIKGSGSAKTLTVNGNTNTSTAQSKFYGSSGLFDGTGDYLSGTDADFAFGTGDFTVECWTRLSSVTTDQNFVATRGAPGSSTAWSFGINSSSKVYTYTDGLVATGSTSLTANVWNHVAITRSGSTFRIFVNGVQDASATNSQNFSTQTLGIGLSSDGTQYPLAGYLQDVRLYKGVAKYTSNFNPPSATQNPAIAAGNDSLVDSPTNYGTDTYVGGEVRGNYCTLNPVGLGGGTLSNGNLDLSTSTATAAVGTVAMKTGKWYWEITCNTVANPRIGVFNIGASSPTGLGGDANGWCLLNGPSRTYTSSVATSYGTFSPVSGTIVNVAYDADAGKLWFGQDGSYFASGNPATGANASMSSVTGSAIVPALSSGGTDTFSANFGQRAFAYTAPSGFKALCTQNLPAPLVTKSNTVFDVVTYTGTGAALTPTSSLGFNPDWIWIKSRSAATDHALYDVVRGAQARLESNTTDAEVTTDGGVTAFNSAGFTLGTLAQVNTSAATYAAWCWDAGTSTVSNTQGSITSQVRANATAGFSVVTWTAPSSGSGWTVGHGLGATPFLLIDKCRSNIGTWTVYHASLGATKALYLNGTDAQQTSSIYWNDTTPTSQVFTCGTTGWYGASFTHVTYCFAPVVGYSSFGSYTGNANADGPFVYTGFRPRWVLWKKSSATSYLQYWALSDAARDGYNFANGRLFPNVTDVEGAGTMDFLSNGFKVRTSDAQYENENGATYIYAAFAEMPFNYSRAR